MTADEVEKGFSEFWKIYPRRVSKKAAIKSFIRALKDGATLKEIIDGAKKYATFVFSSETEMRFVKHPTTWLNNGCWDDEYSLNGQTSDEPYQSNYLKDLWKRAGNA